MKKLLTITMVFLMLLSCVACGQKPEPTPDNDVSVGTNAEDDSLVLPENSTDDSTDESIEESADTSDEVSDETSSTTTEESPVSTVPVATTTKDTAASTNTTDGSAANTTTTTKASVTDKTMTTTKTSVADKTTGKSTAKSSLTNQDKPTKTTTTTKAIKTTTSSKVTSTIATTSSKVLTTQSATNTTTAKPTTQSTSTTKSTKKTITVKTTTTVTTTEESQKKTIRILAVGNSFSVDAMQKHLWNIIRSAGYEEIVLGNLYIGGCSIDTHWNNAHAGMPAYTYYYTSNGTWKSVDNVNIMRGVNANTWDIITVQQASPDSGKPETYSNLSKLVDWLREKQPRAKFFFHMTWAYQQNSTHSAFPNYNKDQMTMYNAICTTVQSKVLAVSSIQGVIPCGTTIQNLRTSSLGDTLTADGHHLNDKGDYAAALTWYCYLLDGSPEDVTYRPSSIEDHFDEIAEAVNNAIKNPYKVTPCT